MKHFLFLLILAAVFSGSVLFGQENGSDEFKFSDGYLTRTNPDGSREKFTDLGQVIQKRGRTFLVWDAYSDGYKSSERQGVYVFDDTGSLHTIIEGPSSTKSYEVDPFHVTEGGEYVVQRGGTWIIGKLNVYSVASSELVFRAPVTLFLEEEGALLFGTVYDDDFDFQISDEIFQIARLDLDTLTAEIVHPATYTLDDDRVLSIRNYHLKKDGSVQLKESYYKERNPGSNKFYSFSK